MRGHQTRKVQLGAGSSRLEGWLNTDIEPGDGLAYLDATKPFPFEDDSVHYIFSEHLIEHLTYDEGKAMMAEAHRVLAPGGKMRISTPNLTRFIELFDKTPSEEARAVLGRQAEVAPMARRTERGSDYSQSANVVMGPQVHVRHRDAGRIAATGGLPQCSGT